MPIYKRCSRCGKRLEVGRVCTCSRLRHREYDQISRDKKSKHYYDSQEWQAVRNRVLTLDEGIDVYLYVTECRIIAADTVHHIIPLKDDWSKRNDVDNLMSLHRDTHSLIEQMYRKDKIGMEQKLARILKEYRG